MKNIILIGMPGAGKSTVGVLLAKSLAYDFTDTDLIIQRQQQMSLQEIIDRYGIDKLLADEEQALLSVSCDRTVVATGGSAVFSEKGTLPVSLVATTPPPFSWRLPRWWSNFLGAR